MNRKLIIGLMLALPAALLLAACSGSDATPVPTTAPTATARPAIPTATATPAAASAEAVAKGKEKFLTCSACHGVDAKGVTGLGKTLVASEFANSKTDAELVAFLKVGRPVSDPANTTGVDMPPKGGNPALSDADLSAIVAYLRSIKE